MADAKPPLMDPMEDLKLLLFCFGVLWLFWYTTGGPARYEQSQEKPFLYAPALRSSQNIWQDPYIGEQYGAIPSVKIKAQVKVSVKSAERPAITIQKGLADHSGLSYLRADFLPSNKVPLVLSGLRIGDIFGASSVIPGASDLSYQGKINEESEVYLNPGSTAFLIEGESPLGVSFRVNKCIGLLSKFQTFYPPLPPAIDQNIDYNQCVDAHKDDPDFYSNDWRIYLKKRVWSETGDFIRLTDPAGSTLASLFY